MHICQALLQVSIHPGTFQPYCRPCIPGRYFIWNVMADGCRVVQHLTMYLKMVIHWERKPCLKVLECLKLSSMFGISEVHIYLALPADRFDIWLCHEIVEVYSTIHLQCTSNVNGWKSDDRRMQQASTLPSGRLVLPLSTSPMPISSTLQTPPSH